MSESSMEIFENISFGRPTNLKISHKGSTFGSTPNLAIFGSDIEAYLSSPSIDHSHQPTRMDPLSRQQFNLSVFDDPQPYETSTLLDDHHLPLAVLPPSSPSTGPPNSKNPSPEAAFAILAQQQTSSLDHSHQPTRMNPSSLDLPSLSLPVYLSHLAPLLNEHGLCIMAIPSIKKI